MDIPPLSLLNYLRTIGLNETQARQSLEAQWGAGCNNLEN